jgi:hypothetical protein
VGSLDIKITAIDSQGATADDDFTLQVVSSNLDDPNGKVRWAAESLGRAAVSALGNILLVSSNLGDPNGKVRWAAESLGRAAASALGDILLVSSNLGELRRTAPSGSGSSVRIDVNGPIGPAAFRTLVTLDAIAPADLTPTQYLI